MKIRALDRRKLAIALAFGVATALAGCGSKQEPAATTTAVAPPAAAPEATPAAPAAAPTPITAADVGTATWTPEALEELLAPIALYPDPVLSQVLIASTNPQEVLDAGNWLVANEGLKGKALDDGAAQAGFTPPIRALVQFPQTIDMMCMELGWTTELGQAFVADQAGVLDAVQRLRRQAMDVGNLKSSEAMTVATESQEGKEVVVLKPPKPEVVYVPTYDPQAVYAPAPAAVAQTTTVTPVETDKKYTTGNMVTTGLLAFGAGILVNELFDDNDDHHNNGYYYPNYGHGGMPYYPPYPYRPSYGGGYYPSNGYHRPPNYNNGGFQNNGNIYVNTGGNNRPGSNNNNYWDRYDNKPRPGNNNGYNGGYNKARQTSSPITQAKPNRADLNDLNKRQPRPMPADAKRPSPNATASNWKGQQSYAGKDKRPASAQSPQDRINAATPGYSKPASTARSPAAQDRTPPKVQGSYAGKDKANRPSSGAMPQQKPVTRDVPKSSQRPTPQNSPKARPVPSGDRGYGDGGTQRPSAQPAPVNRPTPGMQQGGGNKANKGTAMSGANGNRGSAGAASQRGKQSMPQGARSKGGGGKKRGAEENNMKTSILKIVRAPLLAGLVAFVWLGAGCAGKKNESAGYATPEAAVDALVAALEKDDTAALSQLLGPGTEDLLSSGDPVADKAERAEFLANYKARHTLTADGDKQVLTVGDNEWPLPIPLVQRDGKWVWDGAAGADEVIYRRVGANELGAIDVMYGYVNAQNAYAAEGHDGDPAGIYALKLISDDGLHNGLYWPTAAGEAPSPAGPFVASAADEGYAAGVGGTPYHGYHYRMLYAQGPNANGGAREYFKNGVLTEGFAGIAWPADYGASGVMTFIVDQDGVVFQKDLGEDTATAVEAIQAFDPDSSWTAIVPPDVGGEPQATTGMPPAT